MMQRALDRQGKISEGSVNELARALMIGGQAEVIAKEGMPGQEKRLKNLETRATRATGGAVNLMALSKAAKRQVTQSTKGLLNEDDSTVTRALEVANQHI
jgi:hypothetical protein